MKSYLDTGGAPQVGYGLTNTGSFKNFVAGAQWYGTDYEPDHSFAWVLYNSWGGQSANFPVSTLLSAMAVRVGDVAPVPEPGTYALLLAGLLFVGAVARRRKVGSML